MFPVTTVEIAFNAGFRTPEGDRVWTDVTDWVEIATDNGISITRGRADEIAQPEPGVLTLFLDNSDARFTTRNTLSPYYPNVKRGRPIRVVTEWAGVEYIRFTGYVTEWPVTWPDGTDERSLVPIVAVSRMARLGRGNELRSIIEETYLASGPVAYYPLAEAEGSLFAYNQPVEQQPALPVVSKPFSGSPMIFAANTGPGTDNLPAPDFNGGSSLETLELVSGSYSTGAIECFMLQNGVDTGGENIVYVKPTGVGESLQFRMNGSGTLVLGYDGGTVIPPTVVDDGLVHHVVGQYTGTDAELWIDGVLVDSSPWVPAGTWTWDQLYIGESFDGMIAHVAVYDRALTATEIAAHAAAGSDGFEGDTAGARIVRYGLLGGIPEDEIDADTGLSTIAEIDPTGSTVLDMMRRVEATENGLLFDGRDGHLVFHGRARRYTEASAFTLDVEDGGVQASLEAQDDDQFQLNDVTVANGAGTVTARSIAAESVDEYGLYRTSLETHPADTAEVADRALWETSRYADPEPRFPMVDVDLLAIISAELLEADIGTKFTLTGLPDQAPWAETDVIIEGTVESIGSAAYSLGFNVSPASVSEVWVVEDPDFGFFDEYPIAF